MIISLAAIFVAAFVADESVGAPSGSSAARLSDYRRELNAVRKEFGGTQPLPKVSFFLFGMGTRTKLLYKSGSLTECPGGKTLRQWTVRDEVIVPPDYAVDLTTISDQHARIVEDEQAVWIEQDGKREAVEGTLHPVRLPSFREYRYSQTLRVLHQELLMNVINGKPTPNYLVYPEPWRRDGAMVAMCLKASGNLDLIRDWIVHLNDPYDRNNAGETEADNLGESMYLISLVSDRNHPLVPRILRELERWEVNGPAGKYINGRSDFEARPVYQTKWAKFGLASLSLPDRYVIPHIPDAYSALFWMGYKDEYIPGHDADDERDYPYLNWARDHFHGAKKSPISDRDYPLTWEKNASQAKYAGIGVVSESFVKERIAAPHTWHAAEVFLYLLEQKASSN